MAVQTAFQGEVQFRRYSDTSTQGQQVVFAVADRDALESFIGKEGKRFMAVLVEIGDDEQPVVQSANSRSANERPETGNPVTPNVGNSDIEKPRERLGDLAWRAVQWCKEPEFRAWLGVHGDFVNELTEDAASEVIKSWCNVDSRKELDTNEDAKRLFNQLIRGPYQKHLMARGINR
ncbi:hypothetical protein G7048_19260 [Diaphorobacter sp. HDW4B]|uniref:hypothetical protein n=1 Tax=Diaphorobacter sp. HDW4B TaxID=2714925 RepID=UPI001408B608|nr:hypothetical protein [Diaphorobacter sp. HDW4B]QIL72305.1 hypothetical protein G7048_19260 [Diaphorobacter sp. HDW4B]